MEIRIIKPGEKKDYRIFSTIIKLILGIVLITSSNSFVTIAFKIIGIIIIIFGIFQLLGYFKLKNQFKVDNNSALVSGIIGITTGLLVVFLASVLELGLRYVIGFYLVINSVTKIAMAIQFQNTNTKNFISSLIEGIILGLLGIYTIFFANAALMIVGIFMVLSAITDFIHSFNN